MKAHKALSTAIFGLAVLASPLSAQHFDTSAGPAGVQVPSPPYFSEQLAAAQHIDQIEVAVGAAIHGIRIRSTDVTRSSSTLSAWLGSLSGPSATFDVPVNDRLEAVDVYFDSVAQLITALTFRTRGGSSRTFGSPLGTPQTLAITDHEVVGFLGTESPSGITSLWTYCRPVWESTQWYTASGDYSEIETVALYGNISQVRVREDVVSLGGSSVLAPTGIRLRGRGRDGTDLGWMPWLGSNAGGVVRNLSIGQDDYVREIVIGYAGTTPFHVLPLELTFVTNQGASVAAGTPQPQSETITVDAHHELTGMFVEHFSAFSTIGVFQRPIAARTWQAGSGCPGSSGLEPALTVATPYLGGTFGFQVSGPADTAGAILLDFQTTSLPLWTCTLSVGLSTSIAMTTDALGNYDSSIALTDQWYWVGLPLYAQALLFDGNATSPISASDSYGMLFGGI